MKKILIMLVMLLCIIPCNNAKADDVTGVATFDDVGHCVKGSIVSVNTIGETCTRELYTSDDTSYICLLRKYNADKNEYIYYYSGLGGYVWNIDFTSDGAIDGEYVVSVIDPCSCDNYAFSDDGGTILISTNIPIFDVDDVDAITAYVENGDKSGACNNDEYADEYSDDVPLPHNLKILKGADQTMTGADSNALQGRYNHDIVLSWEQADVVDGLQYEIRGMFYYKRIADDNYLEMKEMNTPYITLVNNTNYDGVSSITVKLDTALLNEVTERGYQTKCILAVRNTVSGKSSNWVSVTINLEDKSASANEQSYEDGSIDTDGEYDGGSVDGGTSSGGNGNVSLAGITQYIRDGFGLLGNNGLISLMSQTFLFLPSSVWTILKFYLSAVVAVALAVFVVKVVF